MSAPWYRARAELRERWRATVLLVLIVGLAGGALLTAVAGARRSSTAYDRFREATLAADLDIAFDGPPTQDMDAAAEQIRSLPQVEAMAQLAYPFVVPAGSGMYPYLDFLAAAGLDRSFGSEIEVPRLIDGRLPDPGSALEVALTETYARDAGLGVGDRFPVESYAWEQMEGLFTTGDAGPPAGPALDLRVVGVFSAPIFVSDDTSTSFLPKAMLSSAFPAELGEDVATYPGGFTVRLAGGASDLPEVTGALREIFADATELELSPSSEIDRRIDSGIDVTVAALALCASAVGLAGVVAVGQAIARQQAQQAGTRRWLAALGMSRRDRTAATVLASIPVAVGGAAASVGLAVLASPSMPVGVARRAEPDPGVAIDAPVLAIGFVAIALIVSLLSLVGALAATRRTGAAGARPGGARSRTVEALRRTGAPPAATIGVGMALEPRSGTAWAVRSALAGIGLGAAGVIGVLVFGASIDRLLDEPARYGATYDAAVSGFTADLRDDDGSVPLAEDADAEVVAEMLSDVARIGGSEVNAYALDPIKGDPSFAVLDGRLPTRAGEVALGAEIADDAGIGIGDPVAVRGTSGAVLRSAVVGTAAFPIVDERSAVGRGVLLTRGDLERIAVPELVSLDLLVRWAEGVDVDAANEALGERMEAEVIAPRLPGDVKNLDDVGALPRALAVIVGVLAALAAAHALISTARLRHHDLGVLATLGFERRQLAALLAWQAAAMACLGLAAGVPLGIVLGQRSWRAVAGGIGVVDDPTTPMTGLVVVVVATVVIGAVAAVAPARALRAIRPGAALRARA